MKVILDLLGNRIFLYIIIAVALFGGFQINYCSRAKANERYETYKRQVQGQLTEKEQKLQQANAKIGLMKSKLLSEKDLTKHWKENKEESDEELEKIVKEHNLQIKSMDRTIASLKQTIHGGQTEVLVEAGEDGLCENIETCVVQYNWSDQLGRFKLKDPNIFEKNNETFESNQLFKVYGEVYEQKDGSLQTRRLSLREVTQNEKGEYEIVPGGKADIIDSEFTYSNKPLLEEEWHWSQLFTLRAIALGSLEVVPEGGDLRLGVGLEWFNWEGLGINVNVGFDFDDPKNIAPYLGVSYSPQFFDFDFNLGLGASIGTPFYRFFQEYTFKIDLIFYLHE